MKYWIFSVVTYHGNHKFVLPRTDLRAYAIKDGEHVFMGWQDDEDGNFEIELVAIEKVFLTQQSSQVARQL